MGHVERPSSARLFVRSWGSQSINHIERAFTRTSLFTSGGPARAPLALTTPNVLLGSKSIMCHIVLGLQGEEVGGDDRRTLSADLESASQPVPSCSPGKG